QDRVAQVDALVVRRIAVQRDGKGVVARVVGAARNGADDTLSERRAVDPPLRRRRRALQRGEQRRAIAEVNPSALAPDFDALDPRGRAARGGGQREAQLAGGDRRRWREAVPALRPRRKVEILQPRDRRPGAARIGVHRQGVWRRTEYLDRADLSRRIQDSDQVAAVVGGVLAGRVAVERRGRGLRFERLNFGRKAG